MGLFMTNKIFKKNKGKETTTLNFDFLQKTIKNFHRNRNTLWNGKRTLRCGEIHHSCLTYQEYTLSNG